MPSPLAAAVRSDLHHHLQISGGGGLDAGTLATVIGGLLGVGLLAYLGLSVSARPPPCLAWPAAAITGSLLLAVLHGLPADTTSPSLLP